MSYSDRQFIPLKLICGELVLWIRLEAVFHFLFQRGVGCIMYEMISGRPLFPGATVEDELQLIFRTLGTPTEETWNGVGLIEEFVQYSYPVQRGESLLGRAPRLAQDSAHSLLNKFLLVNMEIFINFDLLEQLFISSSLKLRIGYQRHTPWSIHSSNLSATPFTPWRIVRSKRSLYFSLCWDLDFSEESIFSCPGVMLTREHNYRHSNGNQSSKSRRQSMHF